MVLDRSHGNYPRHTREVIQATVLISKSFLFLFFKKESAFFFEKKKQKTFDYCAVRQPCGAGIYDVHALAVPPGEGSVTHCENSSLRSHHAPRPTLAHDAYRPRLRHGQWLQPH